MRKPLLATSFATRLGTTAMAESVADADANGIDAQTADSRNHAARQPDPILNVIAARVDTIDLNPVDTSATQAMTDAAAGEPLFPVSPNRRREETDRQDGMAYITVAKTGADYAGAA